MSCVDRLLRRLDRPKATGPGRWMAHCPAHEDRTPSLSIREVDGRVLICCHAGCSAGDVMAAVDLELRHLFDRPSEHYMAPVRDPLRPKLDALQALGDLAHEALVVAIVAESLSRGDPLLLDDHRRLIRAAATINSTVARTVNYCRPESRRLSRGETQAPA